MSFGHDFDFSHDAIFKQVHEVLTSVTSQLPVDASVSTVQDHFKDLESAISSFASAKQVPQIVAPTSFKLPHNATFDFGNVQPTVVEKHGDNFSTVTKTWDQHSDSHSGPGSTSWSYSNSSADASPKDDSNTNA